MGSTRRVFVLSGLLALGAFPASFWLLEQDGWRDAIEDRPILESDNAPAFFLQGFKLRPQGRRDFRKELPGFVKETAGSLSVSFNEAAALADAGLEVLFAIDIDNTCMVLDQELGGEPWFNDLLSAVKEIDVPRTKPLFQHRFGQLLSVWRSIINVSGMSPSERNVAESIRFLQSKNVKTIALTARDETLADATLRNFARAGIDFGRTSPGGDIKNLRLDAGTLPVGYQKGVFMLAGQDKGRMLLELMRLAGYFPDVVVFVDNTEKNVDDVYRAVSGAKIAFYGYRYSGTDHLEEAYRRGDKAGARAALKVFRETGRILSDEEARQQGRKSPVSAEQVNVLIYGVPSLN